MSWRISALLLGVLLADPVHAEVSPASPNDLKAPSAIDWVRRPSGDDLRRYTPAESLTLGREGRATLTCAVTARGLLRDCVILHETPEGFGFGQAAVRITPLFKIRTSPWADTPPPSTPVTFDVRFPTPASADEKARRPGSVLSPTGAASITPSSYACRATRQACWPERARQPNTVSSSPGARPGGCA